MKILLTGATGFVGGYIAEALSKDGHEVKALVRPQSDTEALKSWGVGLVEGDLLDEESLRKAVQGIEVVVHAGGMPSYLPEAKNDQILYFKATTLGSFLLLEQARLAGVQQFLFVGSILVYGLVPSQMRYSPVDEEHPRLPREQAGIHKEALESYCRFYHRAFGMNTSVYHLGVVFGQRRKEQFGWQATVERVLKGGRIEVRPNAGNMTVAAEDVAEVIRRAVGNEAVAGEVFNVVDFYNAQADYHRLAAEVAGVSVDICEVGEPARPFLINSDKVRRVLGVEFEGKRRLRLFVEHIVNKLKQNRPQ